MGRSTTSCFKVITTCGSDSVAKDDLEASQGKGSSDKRGWSFRKRSARHRVLSNTVISEKPSANKESPESATVNFQTQANSTVPEKTSAMQCTDEKPQLSTSVNSKVAETIVSLEDDTEVDVNPEESVITVIQAAVRGFLAQRALLKLKNIVKLQAAVRGHLVRRHAVGTLRCVQAIVKLQALVRARRARLSIGGSCTEMKLDGKHGKDNHSSKLLEKENSVTRSNVKYTSIEKLLSNGFARQLLESTPRTKPIHIKCDPSRSDSAWKWLERWMSVSSTGVGQSQKGTEQQEQEKVEHSTCQVEAGIPSESYYETTDLKTSIGETTVPFESEEDLITYDAGNFEFQVCRPTSSSTSDNLVQPQPENTGTSNSKANSLDSLPNQITQSDLISQTELNSLSSNPEVESEQPIHSIKRFAPEQPETEGNKFVFGLRKASNPASIAGQSKFEELMLTANSTRTFSSSNQDVGVESNMDAVFSAMDNAIRTGEIGLSENSVLHTSRVLVGSECGTELSISSTLDSPDRSEVGAMEFEQEAKVLEEGTSNIKSTKNLDVEAKGEFTTPGSDVSYSTTVQPEKLDDGNGADGEPVNSVIAIDSSQVKQELEKNASDVQIELDSETGHQAYKSSPEASPRSHMTVPESQGTPSSQVSVKAKRTKSHKSGSNPKRRSLSAGKRSPANPNHDSGARSSLEQLPKDHKSGKQRNSLSSARPDHVDQEPRDSSSSNSLPSYMQATESARAKAYASSSPRSSPDVQDKDIFIKKRHSLPGANGKQESPRIERSMSQAQQGAKGNGTHPNGIF
uniref:DUF4005 domain-containing protein n=1 Tax=Davidia involucrata TaxID=16924 RepID=A0A5B6ZFK3_DAVIN